MSDNPNINEAKQPSSVQKTATRTQTKDDSSLLNPNHEDNITSWISEILLHEIDSETDTDDSGKTKEYPHPQRFVQIDDS